MADEKKSISVLIPNYNGRQLLEKHLPYTYAALENAGIPFEIIVVDDCSTDDSVSFLRGCYPDIRLLENPMNQGFSATCNRGIAAAQHELLLLLNSDIQLTVDYFANQWPCFMHENTFGVAGQIIDATTGTTGNAGRLLKKYRYRINTKRFFKTTTPGKPVPTVQLSGANALVRTDRIRLLGGFDEIFSPFYSEDTDLSLRAWRMGWACYYDFGSTCTHLGASTIKAKHCRQEIKKIYYRNKFILNAIHRRGVPGTGFSIQLVCFDVLPKLLAGKTWIWDSFTAYRRYRAAVMGSREHLRELMQRQGRQIELADINRLVLDAIAAEGHTIVRL